MHTLLLHCSPKCYPFVQSPWQHLTPTRHNPPRVPRGRLTTMTRSLQYSRMPLPCNDNNDDNNNNCHKDNACNNNDSVDHVDNTSWINYWINRPASEQGCMNKDEHPGSGKPVALVCHFSCDSASLLSLVISFGVTCSNFFLNALYCSR